MTKETWEEYATKHNFNLMDKAAGEIYERGFGITLAARLAEACDNVGGVEKRGNNEAQRYKYVKAADIAKAIRHELFGRGIVILQHEQKPEYIDIELTPDRDNKPRKAYEVRICITFEITDGTTSLKMDGYGTARDSGDKAIWKAKTGALKYFLRMTSGSFLTRKTIPNTTRNLLATKRAKTATSPNSSTWRAP